jgi:hypothetical protein
LQTEAFQLFPRQDLLPLRRVGGSFRHDPYGACRHPHLPSLLL